MALGSVSSSKVLLIGWDAADWKVIHPLLDAGNMPHLARLLAQGVMGNRVPFGPTFSASIATGNRAQRRGQHERGLTQSFLNS